MRVLVVAEQLRRPVPGGIGTYVRGLLQGLAGLDGEAAGVDPPAVSVLASRAPGRGPDPLSDLGAPVIADTMPSRILTRLWHRDRRAAPAGFDVVHAASLAFPPPAGRRPLVVALHDLAWRAVPEAFPTRGRRWHDGALARAGRHAAAVIVPSEATAEAAVAAGVPAEVVRVLAHMYGADHLAPADGPAARATLVASGVTGPYLLSVGTREPRKNLGRILAAYERARPGLPEPWPLVVVGPDGWGDSLEAVPGVVLLGAVPAPVLAALYAGARCLVYAPLLEGFGLPAVEAMASCTPVVASRVPSTGRAALEVDPLDVEDMARGMVRAAADDRLRAELVTAGLLRAQELTWAAAAADHVRLWRELLG